MKKTKLLTIKISEKEKADIKKLADKDGHNSVSGFIMWLIRQYKEGKMVKK